MLAQNNDFIASASQSLYESNANEVTRDAAPVRIICVWSENLLNRKAALSEKQCSR